MFVRWSTHNITLQRWAYKLNRGLGERHCTNPMFVRENTHNKTWQTWEYKRLRKGSPREKHSYTRCLWGKVRITKLDKLKRTNSKGEEGNALHKPGVITGSRFSIFVIVWSSRLIRIEKRILTKKIKKGTEYFNLKTRNWLLLFSFLNCETCMCGTRWPPVTVFCIFSGGVCHLDSGTLTMFSWICNPLLD